MNVLLVAAGRPIPSDRVHGSLLRMRAQTITIDVPERLSYKIKRKLLGRPLVTASLAGRPPCR